MARKPHHPLHVRDPPILRNPMSITAVAIVAPVALVGRFIRGSVGCRPVASRRVRRGRVNFCFHGVGEDAGFRFADRPGVGGVGGHYVAGCGRGAQVGTYRAGFCRRWVRGWRELD
jgi:hypothetical protein